MIGLFLSLLAFALDYRDKVEERTVRAWQVQNDLPDKVLFCTFSDEDTETVRAALSA